MTNIKRVLTAMALTGVAVTMPGTAQAADNPPASQFSKTDRAGLIKNLINDVGLHVITEKGLMYFEDLKKNEGLPPQNS